MLQKTLTRLRRKIRVRSKISWTAARPRLAVFKSNMYMYAQLIDDVAWVTLCSSSNLKNDSKATKTEMAKIVGSDIAKKAMEKGISEVVFDRAGFRFHGRVKALADAARETWLKF